MTFQILWNLCFESCEYLFIQQEAYPNAATSCRQVLFPSCRLVEKCKPMTLHDAIKVCRDTAEGDFSCRSILDI